MIILNMQQVMMEKWEANPKKFRSKESLFTSI